MAGRHLDCVVLGGGPAGSVCAARLAELGLAVCLVHRPSSDAGARVETLAPAGLALIETMGLARRLHEAGIARPAVSIVRWAGEAGSLTGAAHASVLVERQRFDALLRGHVGERGAAVLIARGPVAVRKAPPGWIVEIDGDDGAAGIAARMLVLAGGRRGHGMVRRRRVSPPTLALTARLEMPGMPEIGGVEAGRDWWCWAAPLSAGVMQATFFLAPDDPRLRGCAGLEAACRGLIAGSALLAPLAEARMASALRACDASITLATPVAGDDFVHVGDAAFCLDPLSSQGLVRAMVSAEHGAAVVNTMLRRPGDAAAAKTFLRSRQHEAVAFDRQAAGGHYARQAAHCPSAFWRVRAAAAESAPGRGAPVRQLDRHEPIMLAGDARVGEEPALADAFVVNRTALIHPGLRRPIAFVRNVPVESLLAALPAATAADEVLRRWSGMLGERDAGALLALLWQRGALVGAAR